MADNDVSMATGSPMHPDLLQASQPSPKRRKAVESNLNMEDIRETEELHDKVEKLTKDSRKWKAQFQKSQKQLEGFKQEVHRLRAAEQELTAKCNRLAEEKSAAEKAAKTEERASLSKLLEADKEVKPKGPILDGRQQQQLRALRVKEREARLTFLELLKQKEQLFSLPAEKLNPALKSRIVENDEILLPRGYYLAHVKEYLTALSRVTKARDDVDSFCLWERVYTKDERDAYRKSKPRKK